MKKHRLLSLCLAAFLWITACGAAAAQEAPSFIMDSAGYPVLPEPKAFSVLAATSIPEGPGAWNTPNEIPYFMNMESRTNIHFDWETITHVNFAERFSTLLAADDLPDVVLKAYGLSDSELVTQGTNGMFVNIEPYLETCAPVFYDYCVKNDLLKYLRMGGGIWSFPYIFDSESIQMSKIYFNTDWLKAVGKEMPVTLEEYLDVFRAFRDSDANGNGDPNDEIPLGLCDTDNFISIFAGAFGLMNRGTSNMYIDAAPADASGNTLRFWRGDDSMKELLKMYKQYWDEGLISHNLYDSDYYILFDNFHHEDKHGAHAAWVTVSGQGMIDKFVAPDAPPKGPAGQLWSYISGKIAQKPGLIITKECDDPAAMVAWANYNYTQQGAYDYFLGIENESYVIDENGHTQLTDLINNNPDGTNINNNAGSTHIEVLQKYVKDNNLDVGFAYDGDADRCIAVDENGDVINGDLILYIYGKYMKERGKLLNNTVVTTVMSNFGLYKAFDEAGINYEKTAVGDKYVYENMVTNGHRIGGEQSGHIIFSKYATTGDGILTSLKLMEVMLAKKTSLSKLAAPVVIYPQVLKNIRVHSKPEAQNDPDVQAAVQAVADKLGDSGRILVRESGTEPVIRVMVEAETEALCEKYVDQVIDVIKKKGHEA